MQPFKSSLPPLLLLLLFSRSPSIFGTRSDSHSLTPSPSVRPTNTPSIYLWLSLPSFLLFSKIPLFVTRTHTHFKQRGFSCSRWPLILKGNKGNQRCAFFFFFCRRLLDIWVVGISSSKVSEDAAQEGLPCSGRERTVQLFRRTAKALFLFFGEKCLICY